MKKGYELGGKYSQDPIQSDKPRGKNREQRKSGHDGPSWTPTERTKRAKLMNQFLTYDGPKGSSDAYINSTVWCTGCMGRHMKVQGGDFCERCQGEVNAVN